MILERSGIEAGIHEAVRVDLKLLIAIKLSL